MRVLFVIDSLWGGGTERSLADMLPYLDRIGLTSLVACLHRRAGGVEAEVRNHGTRVHFLPGGGMLTQVRALRRLIREFAPDVVHSSLFRADLVARLARVGVAPVLINSLVNTTYGSARLADASLSRRRVRLAQAIDVVTGRLLVDHFHAVSEAAKLAAIRDQRLPSERITVARRGRDAQRLGTPSHERRSIARRALGISDEAVVLVNVARQDPQKGQVHLVDAFALLAHRHPTLLLLVAGREGSASSRLAAAVDRRAIREQVRFLGHRDDVPDILAASDIFVFPSLWEGYPGAVLEAMALGLPVVAADIPPTREIVHGDTGALVPPGDHRALADTLERLIADRSLRQSMGSAARRCFNERHTMEACARSMVELYAAVLQHKSSQVP